MFRSLFCPVFFSFFSLSVAAQEVNSILLRKAETHFENREWREAAAMFNVLINESPSVLELYAYAVASNDLGGDKRGVMAAVELSEKSGIPLDSLFDKTRQLCTAIGNNGIYERMLLCIKGEQPWFKRIVNKYLLRFYMERKENAKALAIADEALLSFPDNIRLLNAKASILADSGDLSGAADCMALVLRLDSTAMEARLFLGNYYFIKGSELYEKGISASTTSAADSVPTATVTDRVDYLGEARSMFLLAEEYLGSDSMDINTPYVLNTVGIIRERIKELSGLPSAALQSSPPAK